MSEKRSTVSPTTSDPLFQDLPHDLRDSMARPLSDFPARPLLPTGYYFGECIDVIRGNSNKKGTLGFAFISSPKEWADGGGISQPLKKEDKDLLDSIEDAAWAEYEFPRREQAFGMVPAGTIWITPGSMSLCREFFTNMGFAESKPMDECILEMRGKKVLMGIGLDKYERNGVERKFNVMTSLAQDPR